MVCQFLLYNKVNQLYIYIYPHISSLLHLPPTLPIPPLQVVTKHPADLPVLCGCFPLAIYFTVGSVYIKMAFYSVIEVGFLKHGILIIKLMLLIKILFSVKGYLAALSSCHIIPVFAILLIFQWGCCHHIMYHSILHRTWQSLYRCYFGRNQNT